MKQQYFTARPSRFGPNPQRYQPPPPQQFRQPEEPQDDQSVSNVKWTEEQVQKLKSTVEEMKNKNNKVDWKAVGKVFNRFDSECFNKFTQVSEPVWSAPDVKILLTWWAENHDNPRANITSIMDQLPAHTFRGAQFKLQNITKKQNPHYIISKHEMKRTEPRKDFIDPPKKQKEPEDETEKKGFMKFPWKEFSDEEQKQLINTVQSMKEKGEIDWSRVAELFGVQGAPQIVYNKYVRLTEKEFSGEEEKMMKEYYIQNSKDFQIDELVQMMDGHTKRGIQQKLIELTKGEEIRYKMTKEERLRLE